MDSRANRSTSPMKGEEGRETMLALGKHHSPTLRIHTHFVCKGKQRVRKCQADSTSVALNHKRKHLFKELTRFCQGGHSFSPPKGDV